MKNHNQHGLWWWAKVGSWLRGLFDDVNVVCGAMKVVCGATELIRKVWPMQCATDGFSQF